MLPSGATGTIGTLSAGLPGEDGAGEFDEDCLEEALLGALRRRFRLFPGGKPDDAAAPLEWRSSSLAGDDLFLLDRRAIPAKTYDGNQNSCLELEMLLTRTWMNAQH